MKKKRNHQPKESLFNTESSSSSLKDRMSDSVLNKLQTKKSELKKQVEIEQRQKEEQARRERKEREKNMSFQEMFEKSSLDWQKFK
ncbi:MAG: YqkE family protein [Bacilli bacterium]